MRLVALVLLVLGVVIVAGAVYALGEINAACSSNQAQLGRLLGHPDAAKCDTYPRYATWAAIIGLGIAALGLSPWVRLPARPKA